MAKICKTCGKPAKFVRGRGWTHEDGGGVYAMRCRKCGWQGAPAKPTVSCPQCNSRDVVADHVVYVVEVQDAA